MLTTGRIVRHTLVTPLAGESILKPRTGHDTLSPVDDSTTTCCCGACCLVLCTLFGELTPKIADPRPHIKYGYLAPHPSPQPKRHLDRYSRFGRVHCCVQQTDRPR